MSIYISKLKCSEKIKFTCFSNNHNLFVFETNLFFQISFLSFYIMLFVFNERVRLISQNTCSRYCEICENQWWSFNIYFSLSFDLCSLLITAMGHIKLADFGLSKVGLVNSKSLNFDFICLFYLAMSL